jgi:hypothetical protein
LSARLASRRLFRRAVDAHAQPLNGDDSVSTQVFFLRLPSGMTHASPRPNLLLMALLIRGVGFVFHAPGMCVDEHGLCLGVWIGSGVLRTSSRHVEPSFQMVSL